MRYFYPPYNLVDKKKKPPGNILILPKGMFEHKFSGFPTKFDGIFGLVFLEGNKNHQKSIPKPMTGKSLALEPILDALEQFLVSGDTPREISGRSCDPWPFQGAIWETKKMEHTFDTKNNKEFLLEGVKMFHLVKGSDVYILKMYCK